MGFFKAFRHQHEATRYENVYTNDNFDMVNAALIYVFSALALSFIILLPGFMKKERVSVAIRMFSSLFIGATILFSNYGMHWNTASVKTTAQYKAFMNKDLTAKVVVNIGLRGFDVSLKGMTSGVGDNNKIDDIDYVEKFRWHKPWSQGRIASQMSKNYYSARMQGVPFPILNVAEYFSIDGECYRWGRTYQLAGFYTHALLWLSFILWVITNILFVNVVRYGAYFLSLTGINLLLVNLLYFLLHMGPELRIPFPDDVLTFNYGWCFWLCFVTGILCLVLALIIFALDYYKPGVVISFFNIEKHISIFEDNHSHVSTNGKRNDTSSFIEIVIPKDLLETNHEEEPDGCLQSGSDRGSCSSTSKCANINSNKSIADFHKSSSEMVTLKEYRNWRSKDNYSFQPDM
ncbi:dual oxidase maturation factor 1-like [Xenia sp. Carnegie-2017]|uniref:dual oxidase maturation factor 1-like n=1 Tax=Xenia sp. Carnegie-2017 TaxID=2897299 RepID=UPI001F043676|nr:dual oxidase maturation factor 1-like [Xenia sp. Carnegie-2017]